jgi:hypothetical protein
MQSLFWQQLEKPQRFAICNPTSSLENKKPANIGPVSLLAPR